MAVNNENERAPHVMQNFPTLPVKVYSGNPCEFPEFVSEYYQLAKAYGWNDATMIQRLPIYLKGLARDVYNDVMNPVPPAVKPAAWDLLRVAMTNRILPGDAGRIFRQQFYSRKQNHDEHVGEFTYNLSVLAERAFGSKALWNDATRLIVKDQMWSGLKPAVRNALSLYAGDSYEEITKKAVLIETSSVNTESTFVVNVEKSKSVECYRCHKKGHMSKDCKVKLITDQSKSTQCTKCSYNNHTTENCKRKDLNCEKCKRMGHVAKVCRTKLNNINDNNPVRDTVNSKGKIKCHGCGKFGHMRRSCPQGQNNNGQMVKEPLQTVNMINSEKNMTYLQQLELAIQDERNRLAKLEISRKDSVFVITDNPLRENTDETMVFNAEADHPSIVEGMTSQIESDVLIRCKNLAQSRKDYQVELLMELNKLADSAINDNELGNILDTISIIKYEKEYYKPIAEICRKIGKRVQHRWDFQTAQVVIHMPKGADVTIEINPKQTVSKLEAHLKKMKRREFELYLFDEKLEKDNIMLLSGILPMWENDLQAKEKVVEVTTISPDSTFAIEHLELDQLQNDRSLVKRLGNEIFANPRVDENIKGMLSWISTLHIPTEVLRDITQLILPLADKPSCFQNEIRMLIRRNGQAIRHDPDRQATIIVDIRGPDKMPQIKKYNCFTKAIKLRTDMGIRYPQTCLMVIWGSQIDDDEYLVDVGCLPSQTTVVNASILHSIDCNWRLLRLPEFEEESSQNNQTEPIEGAEINQLQQNQEADLDKIEISDEPSPRDERLESLKRKTNLDSVDETAIKEMRAKTLESIINEIDLESNENNLTASETYGKILQIIRVLKPELNIEKSVNWDLSKIILTLKSIIKKLPDKLPEESTRNTIHALAAQGITTGRAMTALAIIIRNSLASANNDVYKLKLKVAKLSMIFDNVFAQWIKESNDWKLRSKNSELPKYEVNMDSGEIPSVDVENRNTQQSRRGMENPTQIILMILMMLGILRQANGFIAYDCQNPKPAGIYSLVDAIECGDAYPTRIQASDPITYYIYQETDYYRTKIRECRVQKAVFEYYCGTNSYTAVLSAKLIPRAVSILPEDCDNAFRTGKLKIDNEVSLTAEVGKTLAEAVIRGGTVDEDGDCTGRTKVRQNNVVNRVVDLEDYTVELREYEGTFEIESGRMISNSQCNSKFSSCRTGYATLIYEERRDFCEVSMLKEQAFVKVNGTRFKTEGTKPKLVNKSNVKKMTKQQIKQMLKQVEKGDIEEEDTPVVLMSADKNDAIRFVRKGLKLKCGHKLYETNYKGIYLAKKIIPKAKRISAADIKMTNYLNNKIDYVYHNLQLQLQDMYQEVILNDCKLNREIIRNRLAISIVNPDLVTPMMMEKGVFGRIMGEAIYSYQCAPVDVSLADYKMCTIELPVMYDGKLRFMSPVTHRLLQENAKPQETICNAAMSPLYKINEQWISLPERKPPSKPVETLDTIKLEENIEFKTLDELSKGGIYTAEEIEQARKILWFPQTRERGISEIIRTIYQQSDIQPNYNLLFGPEHYKLAVKNVISRIWGRFSSFGVVMSGFSGVIFAWILIKTIFTQFLSTYGIFKMRGCSWYLFVGMFPFCAKFFMIKHHDDEIKKLKRRTGTMRHTVVRIKPDNDEYRSNDESSDGGTTQFIQSHSSKDQRMCSFPMERESLTNNAITFNESQRRRVSRKESRGRYSSLPKIPSAPPRYPTKELDELREYIDKCDMNKIQNYISTKPGSKAMVRVLFDKRTGQQLPEDFTREDLAKGLDGWHQNQLANNAESRLDEQKIDNVDTQRENMLGFTPNPSVLMVNAGYAHKPTIKIRINRHVVYAMIDSGSDKTIIEANILNKAETESIRKYDRSLTGANGAPLDIIGNLECRLKVCNRDLKHDIFVMRSCPVECILGWDVMKKLKDVVFDCVTGQLVKLPRKRKRNYDENLAYINEAVTLPPLMETVCIVNTDHKYQGEMMFESNLMLMEKYCIPRIRGICVIKDEQFSVKIRNLDVKPLTLFPDTNMGTIYLPDDEISKTIESTLAVTEQRDPDIEYYDVPCCDSKILTRQQNILMNMLLRKFDHIFAKHEYDLGITNILEHEIIVTTDKPIKLRPYPIPEKLEKSVDKQIKLMLRYKIISDSKSPFQSPLIVVAKKDGTVRLCNDFRKLNEITVKDSHPLPLLDWIFDKLRKALYYFVGDAQKGFYQIQNSDQTKAMTAFSTHMGHYEYNVMPFGLTGAPATFQRAMNKILEDVPFAMVYIDDILIFSETFNEHLGNLEEVFKRLEKANIKLKPTKCKWAEEEVTYVGHVISRKGIRPDPANIIKVQNFPAPKNPKQIKEFLGLAGYYRKFIRDFSAIAFPLTQLEKLGVKFVWGNDQQKAFETLKNLLTSAPILKYPNFEKQFMVMTDASNKGIGAVLGQLDENENECAIAYASRGLKPHEKNYAVVELETLAVIFAIDKFRHYLWGRKIIIYTDHKPLQWLTKHKNDSSRLIRWALKLQPYDIEIIYRKGKENSNADALSRMEQGDEPEDEKEERLEGTIFVILKKANDQSEVTKAQLDDEEINQIKQVLETGIVPTEFSKFWASNQGKFLLEDGLVKYQEVTDNVVMVPKSLREALMLQYHDGQLGGHLSVKKTISRLRQKYFWPDLRKDVKQWCQTCKVCATRRNTGVKSHVPLKPMPVPTSPMEIMAMDVLGPFKLTQSGNKFILVACDYLTKWPEAFAMPDHKADTIARLFVEQIVFRYGVPKKLLTDRGKDFMSNLLKGINEYFGILKLNTSPYHPQTDGLVERFNGTLAQMLASYVNAEQTDWDTHISTCLFAYRNAVHSSTGYSPFYLMYLRNSNMPIDLIFQAPPSRYIDERDYLLELKDRMQAAWPKANLNIKYAQESMKENYDKKTKPHDFKVQDLVMLEGHNTTKGLSPKLIRNFKGPYEVIKTSDTNLVLQICANRKAEPILVHANRCKRYYPDQTEKMKVIKSKGVKLKTDKRNPETNIVQNRYHTRSKTMSPSLMFITMLNCFILIVAQERFEPEAAKLNKLQFTRWSHMISVKLLYTRKQRYIVSFCKGNLCKKHILDQRQPAVTFTRLNPRQKYLTKFTFETSVVYHENQGPVWESIYSSEWYVTTSALNKIKFNYTYPCVTFWKNHGELDKTSIYFQNEYKDLAKGTESRKWCDILNETAKIIYWVREASKPWYIIYSEVININDPAKKKHAKIKMVTESIKTITKVTDKKPELKRLDVGWWNKVKLCQKVINTPGSAALITNSTKCNCTHSSKTTGKQYDKSLIRLQQIIAVGLAILGMMGVVAMWLWAQYKLKKLRLSLIPENVYEMEA